MICIKWFSIIVFIVWINLTNYPNYWHSRDFRLFISSHTNSICIGPAGFVLDSVEHSSNIYFSCFFRVFHAARRRALTYRTLFSCNETSRGILKLFVSIISSAPHFVVYTIKVTYHFDMNFNNSFIFLFAILIL